MLLLLTLLSGTLIGALGQERIDPVLFGVGLVADETAGEGVGHLIDALRHLGYPYDLVFVGNQVRELGRYSLLVIYESGLRKLSETGSSPMSALAGYKGNLLWVGTGVQWWLDRENLARVFGVRFVSEDSAERLGVLSASSGSRATKIFKEDIVRIELVGARAEGYFIDAGSRKLSPAEAHFQRASGGIAHFFAYDVSSWWNADPELPWSRPAMLVSALRLVLSNAPSVRLRPYPRNLDSVFIVRIEDVDPLQATSFDWLWRAQRFLQEHRARKVPLSVALIPVYFDPEFGLEVHIGEDSAKPVREWVQAVVAAGGSITQHGYTHQSGGERTGVGTEFLVNGRWQSYEEQMRRISLGKTEIENSLRARILAFEAPHYKLNEDTLKVIRKLGFRYLFDDLNSPFFGFMDNEENHEGASLVVFPETLGYIPIGSSRELEDRIRASVDQLLEVEGILLQYNHLYDETAFTIGLHVMDYILRKSRVWTANLDTIGRFEVERARSYNKFEVTIGSEITVKVGKFSENGLTISIGGKEKVSWVLINGKEWPLFNTNYVVLPKLTEDSNTISIGFGHGSPRQELSTLLGLIASVIAAGVTLPLARRTFLEEK